MKMHIIKNITISALVLLCAKNADAAASSSNLALLNRCYTQLTQAVLLPSDPMVAKVTAGQDPITVCINDVFRAAFLNTDSGTFVLSTETQEIGKKVLNNFHLLHSSWFHFRGPGQSPTYIVSMPSIYEPNGAANYFTRSLFDQSINAAYFLTGTEYLRTMRDSGPVTDSIYMGAADDAEYGNFLNSGVNVMYERGIVTGIKALPPEQRSFATTTQDNYARGAFVYPATVLNLFQHSGGGILGLDIYVARTVDETIDSNGDGVAEVPRKWSESIFHDLMCLEIPVVRESDAAPYVVTNADGPFRRTACCTSCHVTIDRMAGLIKSVAYSERRTQNVWTIGIDSTKWNKGAGGDYSWSSNYRGTYSFGGKTYSNYRKEDHVGTIFYRNYSGSLIDVRVDSIAALGTALSQQKQPYLCAAKRYYKYFTGIDVNIADPGPNPLPLTPEDQADFDFVVSLADKIYQAGPPAQVGKMSTIIEEILKSPQYKKSEFEVTP